MSLRPVILALAAGVAASAAQAQTYDPAQAQQRLKQQQLDMQSQQLQQLERQNNQALQRSDPSASLQAGGARLRIQRQTETTNALRQQMLSPSTTPGALNAQIQANGARIQQTRPQVPIP